MRQATGLASAYDPNYQRDYVRLPRVKARRRENYDVRRARPGRLEHEQTASRASWAALIARRPLYGLWDACKKRARVRGRPCTVQYEDIAAAMPRDGLCPDCGTQFEKRTQRAASVDETVYGRGYVPGNISIVCKRCNSRKADGSLEWFERVAARIRKARETLDATS